MIRKNRWRITISIVAIISISRMVAVTIVLSDRVCLRTPDLIADDVSVRSKR
jgi:hypothetical protein